MEDAYSKYSDRASHRVHVAVKGLLDAASQHGKALSALGALRAIKSFSSAAYDLKAVDRDTWRLILSAIPSYLKLARRRSKNDAVNLDLNLENVKILCFLAGVKSTGDEIIPFLDVAPVLLQAICEQPGNSEVVFHVNKTLYAFSLQQSVTRTHVQTQFLHHLVATMNMHVGVIEVARYALAMLANASLEQPSPRTLSAFVLTVVPAAVMTINTYNGKKDLLFVSVTVLLNIARCVRAHVRITRQVDMHVYGTLLAAVPAIQRGYQFHAEGPSDEEEDDRSTILENAAGTSAEQLATNIAGFLLVLLDVGCKATVHHPRRPPRFAMPRLGRGPDGDESCLPMLNTLLSKHCVTCPALADTVLCIFCHMALPTLTRHEVCRAIWTTATATGQSLALLCANAVAVHASDRGVAHNGTLILRMLVTRPSVVKATADADNGSPADAHADDGLPAYADADTETDSDTETETETETETVNGTVALAGAGVGAGDGNGAGNGCETREPPLKDLLCFVDAACCVLVHWAGIPIIANNAIGCIYIQALQAKSRPHVIKVLNICAIPSVVHTIRSTSGFITAAGHVHLDLNEDGGFSTNPLYDTMLCPQTGAVDHGMVLISALQCLAMMLRDGHGDECTLSVLRSVACTMQQVFSDHLENPDVLSPCVSIMVSLVSADKKTLCLPKPPGPEDPPGIITPRLVRAFMPCFSVLHPDDLTAALCLMPMMSCTGAVDKTMAAATVEVVRARVPEGHAALEIVAGLRTIYDF